MKVKNNIIQIGLVNQPTQNFSSKPPTLPHLLTVPPHFLQEFVGACKIHSLCLEVFLRQNAPQSFGKTLLKARTRNESRKEEIKIFTTKTLAYWLKWSSPCYKKGTTTNYKIKMKTEKQTSHSSYSSDITILFALTNIK